MPEKNILIADDDQVILDILKEMIQREGYKVFLTSNGKEAVEAIKINPIDLAILDIKMPVMDGIEALKEIKKIDQGIEVLIMTGYADLETLTQAIRDYGAFDYILKPFKRADILNGIQNALLKRDFASQKKLREKELQERILQLEKEFHERTHQLRESQIKYKDIVENSNDAIVVVQDGKLKFANTKTVELTGYPQEELKDMSFLEMVHPEDRDMVAESYKSEDFPNTFSFRALRKSGESLFVEINTVRTTWEKRQASLNMIRDITERKRAEETLRKSEERYRLLAENTVDVIWKMDLNLEFTYVNPAILDTLGFTPEEWIGTRLPKHCSPEEIQKIESIIAHELENLEKHTGVVFETNFFNKNSEEIPGEVNGKILFDENGKPIGFQGSSRDITERKRAEEALRKSEEKYSSVVENSMDGIIVLQKGIIKFLNRAIVELSGYDFEELMDREFQELISPEYRKLVMDRYQARLAGKEVPSMYEIEIIRKDGLLVPIEISNTTITYEGEKATLSFIRNITERKQAENALRASEEKYRELINGMSDTAWVIDFDANFIDVNDAAVEVLGYSREELLSMGPQDIDTSIGVEEIKGLIEQIPTDEIQLFETTHTTKDGKTIPVEVKSSLVTYQEKQVILSIARDITERKQVEDALRASRDYLEKLTNSMWDAVFSVKMPERVIEWANDSFRLIGYEPSECVGKDTTFLYPDKDNFLDFGNKLKDAMAAGKDVLHTDQLLKRKSGETFPAEITVTFHKKNDEVVSVTSIVRDITERKRAAEQLSRHTEQINKHKFALQKLAKMDFTDLDAAIKSTTEEASQTLAVERVSVCLFNEDRSELVCQDLYQLSHDSHEKGLTLKSKDYPNYFRALKEKRTIAADDAQTDPLTNELTEGYLKPLGITSMLDVTIFSQSDLVGVVCAEHTGPLREWSEEEQTFLISIADLVTLALEIARRQQAELELKKHKYRLEELVEGRTAELKEEISERKKTEEELQRNVEDLERFSKLAVGREEQMIKLKKEINELLRGLGQPDKYKIVD